jgi:hypothetical protein
MSNHVILRDHPKLQQVKDQFHHWRRTKDRSEPIAEALWQAAVGLSGEMPLSRIAKALHLGYNDLKQRTRAGATAIGGEPCVPLFIELPHGPAPKGTRWTIEIQRSDGAAMKITREGELDIASVIRVFDGGRS